ncbi:MAG TPA: 3-oxoacyl-[acyl-carrier-protein] reductase [Thermoanaerobaculia bacterium]|nr:3-oxoacyl-[acyl-carrier-protein] reductase [Thermoanaerobaculia bacterium]HUM30896.1 3-oxoacyl-[acyl-carrier-protein] reductase [Thermoanaerobaculia bacterium]HXK69207.1 3-oxoacyl-[acyl-carrier-protein] reductase [Thermoanaerobaculia bacterium]
MDLKGKRALVTGGARGIGAAIATQLADCGADLLLLDIEASALAQKVEELRQTGVKVSGIQADITNSEQTIELVQSDYKANGDCLILVHNAGLTRDNLLMRMGADQWDLVMKVNLYPLHYLTQECLRPMMKARWGRVIAISSVTGLMGNPGQCNYAATKAGVIGFIKSLAREVGSRNITANAVAPGFIRTPMTENLEGDQIDRLKDAISLKRLGEPEDIASAVTFLASPLADYITGTVLNVSGGLYM